MESSLPYFKINNKWLPIVSGLLSMALWAICPLIIKSALGKYNPQVVVVGRFLISTALMLPWAWSTFRAITRVQLKHLVFFVASLSACFLLQVVALKDIPASWYLVVFAANPILILLLFKTKFSMAIFTGVGICLLGVGVFVVAGGQVAGTSVSLGAWLYLLAGMIAWAFYSKSCSLLHSKLTDFQITVATNIFGLASTSLTLFFVDPKDITMSALFATEILWVGILFPLAYFLYSYTLRYNATFGIISQYLEPLIGSGLAVLILGEVLLPLQWVGGALIIVGVYFSTMPKKQTTEIQL